MVDSQATPMRIVAKMYIDSGGGTASNLYQADLYVFPLSGFTTTPNPVNTPAPGVVFNESHMEHADAHGAAIARQDKFLWIADRGRNFLWVVDTRTNQIVNRIQLVNELTEDPTPDLLSVSPKEGSHVFMSLRGPVPLTANPHVSTGTTPGIGVLKVLAGGRSARFESIARISNVDPTGAGRADVWASTVRQKRWAQAFVAGDRPGRARGDATAQRAVPANSTRPPQRREPGDDPFDLPPQVRIGQPLAIADAEHVRLM